MLVTRAAHQHPDPLLVFWAMAVLRNPAILSILPVLNVFPILSVFPILHTLPVSSVPSVLSVLFMTESLKCQITSQ